MHQGMVKRLAQGALMTGLCLGASCASGGNANAPAPAENSPVEQVQPEEGRVVEVLEEEVRFEAANTTVFGTLTRPRFADDAAQAVPAVVLVAGSGPTDRNWESPLLPGENGSARLLARALGEQGIAVLRYDKRATGQTAFPGDLRWEDYLAEIAGALGVLSAHEAIDAGRLFVAGHSEGGAHALRALQEEAIAPAGVMLLAAAGRPLSEVIVGQVEAQLQGANIEASRVQAEVANLRRALASIADGQKVRASRVSLYPGVVQLVEALQAEDSLQFSAAILDWSPTQAIAGVKVPLLILNGEKDLQVDPELDARALAGAARSAGVDAELVIAPDADHVLKHQPVAREELNAQHGLLYNQAGRTLDPQVVEAIVDWVQGH
ncbi:lysophospholipase [Lujinxingia vulgaris]|uniref:Lysophospholipase n=1 Tax=Lujinxingia vulgaris TaxID=2600176 RepID=A0A5C6X5Q1_9DELT|nr:alpha/beta fold hydrolase [Lujinxingia vulgaris]TXD37219.1 lysophospholipase [Lujinxingia vulgaris]